MRDPTGNGRAKSILACASAPDSGIAPDDQLRAGFRVARGVIEVGVENFGVIFGRRCREIQDAESDNSPRAHTPGMRKPLRQSIRVATLHASKPLRVSCALAIIALWLKPQRDDQST